MAANDHSAVIRQLANLVLQMHPLAERVASDEFSPTERMKLRKLAGIEEVISLSNALNLLVGETTRDMRLAGKTSLTQKEFWEMRGKRDRKWTKGAR
jgi:hypothetical protein